MIRRLIPPLLFLAGVILAAVLAIHAGIGAILQAIAAIGWGRLTLVCLLQMVALWLCALAWWRVSRASSLRACFLARWIRDGASNLIGFVPVIGETISGRALTVLGAAGPQEAAASTVVDVAVESLALALYTILGLLLLLSHLDHAQAVRWLLIVIGGVIPVLAMYLLSRHAGALEVAERWGLRMAAMLGLGANLGSLKLAQTVHAIYAMRGRVAAAFGFHMLGWAMGAAQVWLAAQGTRKNAPRAA